MRKRVKICHLAVALWSVIIMLILTLTGCTDRSITGNTNIRMGNLKITIGQISHEGLVYEYLWDSSMESLVIDIPDVTDHDEKITEPGGYANIGVPAWFGISLKPFDDGFEPWTGPYGRPISEGTREWKDAENARIEYMKQNPLYERIVIIAILQLHLLVHLRRIPSPYTHSRSSVFSL